MATRETNDAERPAEGERPRVFELQLTGEPRPEEPAPADHADRVSFAQAVAAARRRALRGL